MSTLLSYGAEQRLLAVLLAIGGACVGGALILQGIARALGDTTEVLS